MGKHLPLTIAIIFAMFTMSCGNKERRYTIGVSQCSSDSWRVKFNEEMTLSTFFYDNVSLIMESAHDDDNKQIEQINALIDKKVDLLVVSPNQVNTVSKVIDRANSEGIPVILFDRKSDTPNYCAYIGADNVEMGREMARYIISRLGGKGKILEVQGLRRASAAIERHKGFAEVISQYPDIEIVGECYCGWVADEARKEVSKLLDTTHDFNAVFAHNDRMAMGARAAIEAKGIKGIVYVGIDALPSEGGGLEMVSQGKLDATYIYPTRGDLVVQLALDILEGKPYKRENTMQGALVTKDNAYALQLQNVEMEKQRSRLYDLHSLVDQYLAQYSHQRMYALLLSLLLIMVIISFTIAYRWIVAKRHMTEKAAEAKLTFFTNVSHEFRTPLTLIADPIDRIITDTSLDDDQRLSLARLARRNVSVVLQMVNQILDFRKYQNGKMTMRLSRFDLSHEVSLIMESFKPACDHKEVELRLTADSELLVVADKRKIDRIVYNLLSNALKFTPNGGHIEVKLVCMGDKVTLTVADDGCGMDKGDTKHVFERFYQAENAIGGTGIGLALVKMFIDMHHGTVDIDSEKGKGTSFIVTLPREQKQISSEECFSSEECGVRSEECGGKYSNARELENSQSLHTPHSTLLTENSSPLPTLLVVDDNDDVRTYIAGIMGADYRVIQAADGQTAIDRAIKEIPDIIVSDVMMPGIDGLELCRRLKQERATSHIPIIILTARSQDEQRAEGYDYGADAYITKPFSSQVLLARVKNLLDNRRQMKSLFGLNDTIDIKAGDADSQFIRDFNACIAKNMGNSAFNVDMLAAELRLSRAQAYRKVKALTGCSPVELIRTTRLKRADQMLRSGGRTVSEVCYEVGFTSPSYFAKCFKEEFGRLPSE